MLSRALLVLCLSLPTIGCGMVTDFSGLTGPETADEAPADPASDPALGTPPSGPQIEGTGGSPRNSRASASNDAIAVAGGGTNAGVPAPSSGCMSAGPFIPSTAANATSWSGPWFGVGQSVADNATFHAALILQNASDELLLTNFHASIPPKAKIVGLRFNMTKSAQAGDSTDRLVSLSLKEKLVGASRAMTSTWPTERRTVEYGSPTDTWGTTLTGAEVSDPSFGIGIMLNAGFLTNTAEVSAVTMTVDYCD
jgi:hypothetical protein